MGRITVKERGWPGHFSECHRCVFHRNTLISDGDKHIVVSSVGNKRNWKDPYSGMEQIGIDRYYETKVFFGHVTDNYIEADISRGEIELPEDYDCGIYGATAEEAVANGDDNKANLQHDALVNYFTVHFNEAKVNRWEEQPEPEAEAVTA